MAKTIAVSDEQGVTGLDRAKATPARLMDFLKDVRAETRKVVFYVWGGRLRSQASG